MRHLSLRYSLLLWCLALTLPPLACGAPLNLANDVQRVATLTSTTATLSGKAELHVTGTGDPLTGTTVNLTSPDAWFFLDSIPPSTVVSTFLSRVTVNGAAAVSGNNVRVVQYGAGAVVIPHTPDFGALEVFDGQSFSGNSALLQCYTPYVDTTLGAMKGAIRSFRLKRGYTATVAQNAVGTGISQNYVAQDGDLEVGVLPGTLDKNIAFIRVFPWRWTSKRGIAGNLTGALKPAWWYDWNIDQVSNPDLEYVAIRHTRYWPDLGQDWKSRGVNSVLGYNEPDQSNQANMAVGDAIYSWPDLLGTGLRTGAPAVSDGGLTWLYSFMSQADAANLRVDYVPVHYYRGYSNASNPSGAATQFYNFLKGIHDTVKRPIWVTEWNNGATWTTTPVPTAAQQQAAVAAMIDMLDNTPWVERYSFYNWVGDTRRLQWDDGSLTAAGVTYRDDPSPLSYTQILASNPANGAARYTFDGDGRDASGNGNDAMQVGTPSFTTGKYGQAVVFDGTDDCALLPPQLANGTDFTFAGWIKWNGGASWQRAFDFGADTTKYMFLSPSNGTSLRFAINSGAGEQTLSAAKLTVGQWTHVAVTLSGNTGKLFVNGVLAATNTAMTANPVDLGATLNYLGKSQFATDPLFNGQLDDLRFLPSALTDAQVAAIANSVPLALSPNPVAGAATKLRPYTASLAPTTTGGSGTFTFKKTGGPAWLAVAADGTLTGVPGVGDAGLNRFLVTVSDTSGSVVTASVQITVVDTLGLVARYAFDGTAASTAGSANGVVGGTVSYVAGVNGTALNLSGTSAYVTLPQGLANSDQITLAAWVLWNGGNNWQRIFDFGNSITQYLCLTPSSGTGKLRFEIKNNGVPQGLETSPLTVGQWTHVAVTLGGNVGSLYVNGSLVSSGTITTKPGDFKPALNYLGKSQFTADPYFKGRLDEFQVFNQALSVAQISALANGHAPTFTTRPISKPTAPAGTVYEQTLAGSATDPDAGSTLTYAKASGPNWLTVGANGRLSGIPSFADAGTNRFVVRVTDGSLLSDEAILNVVVPGSGGLLANYQFDGNLADGMGGTAGTGAGSIVYGSGLFDQALLLNGSTSYVQLPAGFLNGLGEVTVSARVRWNGGSNWQRIFDFGNGTTQYMSLTPSSGAGTLRFLMSVNGNTNEQRVETTALPVGEWTQVAITLNGTTGTLYVNGVAVSSAPISLTPAALAPTYNYLGKSQFNDPLFNGTIDDFRVFNRALTPSEVYALAVPSPAVNVPDSTFAGWATGIAFPAGQGGPLADPDGDGLCNLWEYLLGSNPLSAGALTVLSTTVAPSEQLGLASTGKHYLTLQVRVRTSRPGVTIIPEAAPDMVGLVGGADVTSHARQTSTPVADGDYQIITYYYDVAVEDSPTGVGVMRLRATLQQ